ncbi:MAG: hypothetical protein ACI8XV_000666 [Arenicella sp.]|jgi:hypothetical protein
MKLKSIAETAVTEQKNKQQLGLAPTRRELLVWSAPVIAAISLPVHAQTSSCTTAPTLQAVTPAKCAGENPQGEATLRIISSDALVDVQILSVTDNAVVPNAITYSATSGIVGANSGLDIKWDGPSTDAVTCLPAQDVTFTITYTCSNDPLDFEVVASLVDILAGAVP